MIFLRTLRLLLCCLLPAHMVLSAPEQISPTPETPSQSAETVLPQPFSIRDRFACVSFSPAKDGGSHDSWDRRARSTSAGKDREPPLPIRFLEEKDEDWSLAETPNFRIFHKHDKKLVEQVARVVERSRLSAYAKWVGGEEENWKPKCYLYLDNAGAGTSKLLHDARGYAKRGGLGFSTRRYVRVRAKDTGLLVSVLPHEITH